MCPLAFDGGPQHGRLKVVILAALTRREASLTVVEMFTSGHIAARLAPLPGAERVFRRGVVARDLGGVATAVGLDADAVAGELTAETAELVAEAAA